MWGRGAENIRKPSQIQHIQVYSKIKHKSDKTPSKSNLQNLELGGSEELAGSEELGELSSNDLVMKTSH